MHVDYNHLIEKNEFQSAISKDSKCQNGTWDCTLDELKKKGYIQRLNGKRNGKWEVLVELP